MLSLFFLKLPKLDLTCSELQISKVVKALVIKYASTRNDIWLSEIKCSLMIFLRAYESIQSLDISIYIIQNVIWKHVERYVFSISASTYNVLGNSYTFVFLPRHNGRNNFFGIVDWAEWHTHLIRF